MMVYVLQICRCCQTGLSCWQATRRHVRTFQSLEHFIQQTFRCSSFQVIHKKITDLDLYYVYIRATHRTIDCDSLNLLSAAILCLQQAITQLTMLPVTVNAICFCLLCSLLCSELEDYVDHLQRSSITGSSQLSVTLRDVEEGAMSLRGVGETLAILKG